MQGKAEGQLEGLPGVKLRAGPVCLLPGAQTWVWGGNPSLVASCRRCRAQGKAVPGAEAPWTPASAWVPCGPQPQSTRRCFLAPDTAAAAGKPASMASGSAASAGHDVRLTSLWLAICRAGGRPGECTLGLGHSP